MISYFIMQIPFIFFNFLQQINMKKAVIGRMRINVHPLPLIINKL